MRHRVTYIHSRGKENGIESLNSTHVAVVPGSSREDKLTFDTPRSSHIRSIRVQVIKPFEHSLRTTPFAYDYQIGLHIYIVPEPVPGPNERDIFYEQVNEVLQGLFGISLQERDWILSLNSLYFHTSKFLEPQGFLSERLPANWDAIDYSVNDETAVLKSLQADLDSLEIDATDSPEYKEVGIFGVEELTTRDDLVLSGVRVVFNDEIEADQEESGFVHRTLFHIKPRHRQASPVTMHYKANGLHPVISVANPPQRPEDDDIQMCRLYYYLSLEKSTFVDPYQVPDLLVPIVEYGTRDLELPEYAVEGWGNEFLMQVDDDAEYPIDLTLHSRYQLPSNSSAYTNVLFDKPLLFYGCEVGSDAFLLKNSPFDNKAQFGGSYEKFFTENTVFYRVLEPGLVQLQVPNARGDASFVNLATLVAVLLGVLFIVPKLWNTKKVSASKKNE